MEYAAREGGGAMKKYEALTALLCIGICVALTACVTKALTNYLKPGIDRQQFEADHSDCERAGEQVAKATFYSPYPFFPFVPALAPGYFETIDSCMKTKGYNAKNND